MEKFKKGKIFAWMPIIGFDKDKPDKGVGELLNRMQHTPHGVSVFIFHADIVHFHEGLDREVTLPPDNCAYYANPYNEERRRQAWTNFDLKALADELKVVGIEAYLGIMGVDLEDRFHKEWLSEHAEVKCHMRHAKRSLNVLKRMEDGSYYEDFFVDKVCQTLTDYGFAGLHVTDDFCPQSATLYAGDYSADMLGQFTEHTGIVLPEEIAALTEDSFENINRRGDWIWEHCREAWIQFYAWRWEQFWKKICTRLHAIGKKVFVIGTYCTDPFETLYCKGVDQKRIVAAGVDILMPNILPVSVSITKKRPFRYYQYMTIAPLMDAFVNGGKSLGLLGVKDASEEWDVLHHLPMNLERDIYTMPSYFRKTGSGMKRCLDGLIVCLGDGIYKEEWKWLYERFDRSFAEAPESIALPTMIWSDAAFYNTLPEYIETRRWTLHKFMYELAKIGAYTGAIARIEDLDAVSGPLFVPNFDLLPENEREKIAAYKNGAVICTAAVDKAVSLADYEIEPDIYFEDTDTPYKNCAFAFHMGEFDQEAVLAHLCEKNGIEDILDDPFHAPDEPLSTLTSTLPFQRVTAGFLAACGQLLKESCKDILVCTLPVTPMWMKKGCLRIYIANDDRLNYGHAVVTTKNEIDHVENGSHFPLLPVKFTDDGTFNFMSRDYPDGSQTFRVRVPPAGMAVVDVYFKTK